MSVWPEKLRRCPDSRHKLSGQTTVRSAFQISLKFFPELSRILTVLPKCLDDRTSTARNFHIKAWCVQTIAIVVRTVDLMHTISIYEA
jgi:hypothetical protein